MRRVVLELLLRFHRTTEPGPVRQRIGSWLLRSVPGMLTCEAFEAFILDYYEGDVSDDVRVQFETHMRLCPMCAVHFDSYVRAVALGKKVCDDDELPEALPDELLGAILLAREGESGG